MEIIHENRVKQALAEQKNTKSDASGEILDDGKNDWQNQKLKSLAVSRAFSSETESMIGRSQRIFECASTLEFETNNAGVQRLSRVWFCKDRMCPMCQKRRSLVVFHQVKSVCTAIQEDNPTYKYLLLTLTVPNVTAEDLPEKIKEMSKAWKRLSMRKEFKTGVKGWFRTLEVTCNNKSGEYHPHYHVLLCVPSGYFKKNYIKHSRWLELWQESMKDFSITQVDVRAIKPNPKKVGSDAISSAAAEVGKYATKPSNYLAKIPNKDKYLALSSVVQDLAASLTRKKLVAFGGLMLEYSLKLNLQDVENQNVDLINIGDDSDQIEAVKTELFRWNIGFSNYIAY